MPKQRDVYVTATQARELLGVSKGKMTAMIREGEIPVYPDPRNKRAKLVKKADIDAWLARTLRPPSPPRKRNPTIEEQGGNEQKIKRAA